MENLDFKSAPICVKFSGLMHLGSSKQIHVFREKIAVTSEIFSHFDFLKKTAHFRPFFQVFFHKLCTAIGPLGP
jgi:hypothetical protein